MRNSPVRETLQATAVISKTTQTLIGKIIPCGGYDFVTLFFTYTKGDETGLTITPWFMNTVDGTAHPFAEWSTAAGAKTTTASTYTLTATVSRTITVDVRGIEYIKFTQGGTSNDGTPTGTLAAAYSMK